MPPDWIKSSLTLAFIPISPAVQQDVGENGIDLGALAVGEDCNGPLKLALPQL